VRSVDGLAECLTARAVSIVDLLHRHAPADADLDVRLTPAAGTTTALTHEALTGGARAVVAEERAGPRQRRALGWRTVTAAAHALGAATRHHYEDGRGTPVHTPGPGVVRGGKGG
jgi:hypothetical protein